MTIGPGKYDDEAGMVLDRTNAAGVILIVIGGDKGQGFSVQATPEVMISLPTMLRSIADQIEADMMKGGMAERTMTCCLCAQPYDRLGNNPAPLATSGRCCDSCNEVVTEARINPFGWELEIERVETAMLHKADLLRQCAIAAICASRGPALWLQRRSERRQLMAMIERDGESDG